MFLLLLYQIVSGIVSVPVFLFCLFSGVPFGDTEHGYSRRNGFRPPTGRLYAAFLIAPTLPFLLFCVMNSGWRTFLYDVVLRDRSLVLFQFAWMEYFMNFCYFGLFWYAGYVVGIEVLRCLRKRFSFRMSCLRESRVCRWVFLMCFSYVILYFTYIFLLWISFSMEVEFPMEGIYIVEIMLLMKIMFFHCLETFGWVLGMLLLLLGFCLWLFICFGLCLLFFSFAIKLFVLSFRWVAELPESVGNAVFLSEIQSVVERRAWTAFVFVPLFVPLLLGMRNPGFGWPGFDWMIFLKALPFSYALTGLFLVFCVWVMRKMEATPWLRVFGLWFAFAAHAALFVCLLGMGFGLWAGFDGSLDEMKYFEGSSFLSEYAYQKFMTFFLMLYSAFFLYSIWGKNQEAVRMTWMAVGGAVLVWWVGGVWWVSGDWWASEVWWELRTTPPDPATLSATGRFEWPRETVSGMLWLAGVLPLVLLVSGSDEPCCLLDKDAFWAERKADPVSYG